MYIGVNNYEDYDPDCCDGHSCPRDCQICPWRWENRDIENGGLKGDDE